MAELAATSPPVRLGSAMPTVWDIQKYRPGLMEGRFEFHVHLGTVTFYRYVTDEIVLHEPDHRFRWLFPPIVSNIVTGEIEVDVDWIEKSGQRWPLRMQLLRVPATAFRTVFLGVAEHRTFQRRRPDWDARVEALKLESLGEPVLGVQAFDDRLVPPLQTVMITWDDGSFPSDPLAFAQFDIVAIGGNVFANLRRPQLEALLAWCRAGGSVYVEPEGILEPYHVEFLDQVTEQTAGAVPWMADSAGRLVWPLSRGSLVAYCDLGRAAVVNPEQFQPARFVGTCAFLWDWPSDLNPNQVAQEAGRPQQENWQYLQSSRVPNSSDVETLRRSIENALMPASIRVVPLPLIIGVLTGLVLLIGPIDWWLLGRLRLRRFTWITWPVWTLTFSITTVALSNRYLQATDTPRTLTVHDLGRDGRIVRTQVWTLTFASRARVDTQDVERGIWEPLGALSDNFPSPTGTNATFTFDRRLPTIRNPPRYVGRVPSRYVAEQAVGQWVPQMSYRFHIPDAASDDPPPIDWEPIDAKEWVSSETLPPELGREIQRQLGQLPMLVRVPLSGGSTVPGISYEAIAAEQGLGNWLNPLRELTQPRDWKGKLMLLPDWYRSPFSQASLHPLRDTEKYASSLLVVVRSGEMVTVYRRLISNPGAATFQGPSAP